MRGFFYLRSFRVLLLFSREKALNDFADDGYELFELLVSVGRPAVAPEFVILFCLDVE